MLRFLRKRELGLTQKREATLEYYGTLIVQDFGLVALDNFDTSKSSIKAYYETLFKQSVKFVQSQMGGLLLIAKSFPNAHPELKSLALDFKDAARRYDENPDVHFVTLRGSYKKLLSSTSDMLAILDEAITAHEMAAVFAIAAHINIAKLPERKKSELVANLCIAAQEGQTESVRALLAAGVSPNILFKQTTPLICATWNNRSDTVKVLLAAGANKDVQDKDGQTPLMYAQDHGFDEIVQILTRNRLTL